MNSPIEGTTAVETVKTAVTARSFLIALKENRIEVLLMITLLHKGS